LEAAGTIAVTDTLAAVPHPSVLQLLAHTLQLLLAHMLLVTAQSFKVTDVSTAVPH
jgi:hypothetical protein